MDFTYDIFRTFPGGDPMWVEAVTNLEKAKERLHSLPKIGLSKYLLFDSRAGEFVESLMKSSQPSEHRKGSLRESLILKGGR